MHDCYAVYYEFEGARFFNAVLKPEKEGKFPVILFRTPYVDAYEDAEESKAVEDEHANFLPFVNAGFAVILQHCRGRGKSGGDCIPYIHEREDSNAMLDWVRTLPFYNGSIYLKGSSYCTSVWYAAAPYAGDIKGALFSVQISDRYPVCYTNGILKKELHGSWYVRMYKAKSHLEKHYTGDTLDRLPLTGVTKEIFGEYADDFEELIRHPDPKDGFWSTRYGGGETKDAEKKAHFPMLFASSWFDIYTGGMFALWDGLPEENKARSAFVVSAYNHGDSESSSPIKFPNGSRNEQFPLWEVAWFSYLEHGGDSPFPLGQVTYYTLFENVWRTDARLGFSAVLKLPLGDGVAEYDYDPAKAPGFAGGLSRNFGGAAYQDKPGSRDDIVTVYTAPFTNETVIRGRMRAKLTVSTDCEDTCFLVRVSIEKPGGDYGLRDDITSVLFQHPGYTPGSTTELDFVFDEISLKIVAGERLRIDLASADKTHYVRHTNRKGLFSAQTEARVAHNRIDLSESFLVLPIA